jgi:hypothetical protein
VAVPNEVLAGLAAYAAVAAVALVVMTTMTAAGVWELGKWTVDVAATPAGVV